ncbi:ribonuclease HII [Candidatus Saccharibacteria bacterium]|nr:ribonuclease HII [Candidatus Saccharibacteria bacterium]
MAILGIDEVGRGPLAGPLVVGAVVLPDPKPSWIADLRDSKKLSAKNRERLSQIIKSEAPAVGLGWVSPTEIDSLGISEALRLATRRAVEAAQRCGAKFSEIIIDGKVNFLKDTALEHYTTTVVKADNLIKEVSAASIVAKQARDAYMVELATKFPEYGFENHVGYGTAAHLKAIYEFGPCKEHRQSFEPIKSLVGFAPERPPLKNTTEIGSHGETAVCEYLTQKGHEIVERNFKTYFYEIDIISIYDGTMYFTEVKTRKDASRGGGLAAIDSRKLQKMQFAAECFAKCHGWKKDMLLAVASVDGNYALEDWLIIH